MDERFGVAPPGLALALDELCEPFHLTSPYSRFLERLLQNERSVTPAARDEIRFPIIRRFMCGLSCTTTTMPEAPPTREADGGRGA